MKRQIWIPLALGIVAMYIILDRRACRYAAEYNELDAAADRTEMWGSRQRIAGTGRDLLGRVKEGIGRITGNDDLAGRGVVDQVVGAGQNAAGRAAHRVSGTIREFNRY